MRIQANRRTRRLSILFTGLLVSLPAVAQTDRTFVTSQAVSSYLWSPAGPAGAASARGSR